MEGDVANEWNALFWNGDQTGAAIRLTKKELSDLRKFSCDQFSGDAATSDDTAELRLIPEHPFFKLLENRNYRNRNGMARYMVPQTSDIYYERLARGRRRRAQNGAGAQNAGAQNAAAALVPASANSGDETKDGCRMIGEIAIHRVRACCITPCQGDSMAKKKCAEKCWTRGRMRRRQQRPR